MVNPFKGFFSKKPTGPPVVDVNNLDPFAASNFAPSGNTLSTFNGDKFFGGFGVSHDQIIDYHELRLRSSQLFNENLYARGLIRRLVTNEINTGLHLEAIPNGDILGLSDDKLNVWSEDVENRFSIWAKSKHLCDYKQESTFGALQETVRREALVSGDVLVVLKYSKKTSLPQVQLVSATAVNTPFDVKVRAGNEVKHGVELDSKKRQVAYWVSQKDGTSKRVPAIGERSGRRIAWMVYGTDKRLDEVRGQPMLALILQSLKEIDRYRDSAQRKAVINSILAMFIKKGEDKQGTLPITGGAVRKDSATVTDPDGSARNFGIAGQIPGLVLEELQTGEEPVGFNSAGTDINFPIFEAAVIHAVAWCNEVPPEVLTLAFSSNYSASRGAVIEFKLYLNKIRMRFAESFTEVIYPEWLLSEVLLGKIDAQDLLDAWRDPHKYDIYGAWIASDWSGAIKPSVDLKKEVSAYKDMIAEGLITRERAARELNGMKYTKVVKRLQKENELQAEALRPLFELAQEFGVNPDEIVGRGEQSDIADDVADKILQVIDGGKGNA